MTEVPIRVALADDDVLLREGLASLLDRSGFEVVGQCGDATQLLALVRDQRPELVIVDIRMPPSHSTEGLDAARQIRSDFPGIAVLVLSAHVEVEHAMDLLACGEGSGYLLKSRVINVDDFIGTLQRLVRGGSIVDPALVAELVSARRLDDPLDALSPREREVLALMAEGRSNSGISKELWVTEGTIEKHVRSILMKLRLPETDDMHRRVLAVLKFLGQPGLAGPAPRPSSIAASRNRSVRLTPCCNDTAWRYCLEVPLGGGGPPLRRPLRKEYVRVAVWGSGVDDLEIGARYQTGGHNVATLVLRDGESARIDDAAEITGEPAAVAAKLGFRSVLGTPIVSGGRVWGLIAATTTRLVPMPADTEQRVAGFTELTATAISDAQAGADLAASRRQVVSAADDMRRRIERNLHDGTQQRLVTLALASIRPSCRRQAWHPR